MKPSVAIAGNPNTGKTSLFNSLTGSRQQVGNWPGQTIELHTGQLEAGGVTCDVVDVPGVYGLLAVSAEERIASECLLDRPDVVITVVDVTNLEQSLHVVAQIAEAGLTQVVAANMSDVAERRGITIDLDRLTGALASDVIPTVARRGEGCDRLLDAVGHALATSSAPPLVVDYGPVIEQHLAVLTAAIAAAASVSSVAPARWLAVQMISSDECVRDRIAPLPGADEVLAAAERARNEIEADVGLEAALALAERRFDHVRRLSQEATGQGGRGPVASDRVDRLLTHPILGLGVFLAVMWLVLKITADVTAPYLDWLDEVIAGPVGRWAVAGLAALGGDGTWVEGLVVDGVLAGVGGVLVFIPVLGGLYLTLAVLEDSGYMARAALVMERAMRAIGVPGKAFLPMMVGFGCTVPAIYATRTLDTHRDRLLTGLLVPFMSCSARLPVYVLLASIFFAGSTGSVIFAMYLLGVAVAVAVGALLGRTMLPETEPTPFVMVLPAFRLPNAHTVWTLVRRRTWAFVEGAGTLILMASIVVWGLLAIPVGGGSFGDTDVEDSAFGAIASATSTLTQPLGFGEWEQTGALMSGFVAKEVVVSTMNQLYGEREPADTAQAPGFLEDVGEIGSSFVGATWATVRAIPGVVGLDFAQVEDETSSQVESRIRDSFESASGGHGSLAAFAFMVFVLLYTPCIAAVGALRDEFGTRWMALSVAGQLGIAWLGAFVVFQVGRLLGLG